MKKTILFSALTVSTLFLISCGDDDDDVITIDPDTSTEVVVPSTFVFERDGESTVSFSGQTSRILMAEELISTMNDFGTASIDLLLDIYANENDPFANQDLNESTRNIIGKICLLYTSPSPRD